MLKPLDFVHPVDKPEIVGMITEVGNFENGYGNTIWQASIKWLGNKESITAWWLEKDLIVIDNLPNLLTKELAHPFGNNKDKADLFYPIKKIEINTKSHI